MKFSVHIIKFARIVARGNLVIYFMATGFFPSLSMATEPQFTQEKLSSGGCGIQVAEEGNFRIGTVESAKDPQGILRILKKIHEESLLLDPEFISDERIAQIFGSGKIEQVDYKDSSVVVKRMSTDDRNLLKADFSFFQKRYSVADVRRTIGSLTLVPQSADAYSIDEIEKYLTQGVEGKDFLKEQFNSSIDIHVHESYSKRPPPTASKGYFMYEEDRGNGKRCSRLRVRLDKNANLRDITIDQSEK